MSLDLVPKSLRKKYRIDERNHACAILAGDFPSEFRDIMDCLTAFTLRKSDVVAPGGRRSTISEAIDGFLSGWKPKKLSKSRKSAPFDFTPIGPAEGRGWNPKTFDIKIEVDGNPIPIPTHHIDNFKNRVGLEVEWNNKDPFFDRDLNNFRLLYDLGVLSVGVIITRLTELQQEFIRLGKGESYGASTTHWNKLIPKVDGGGAGGCPLLLIGMGMNCYDPNS
jgi:Restriction endonuclease BglII